MFFTQVNVWDVRFLTFHVNVTIILSVYISVKLLFLGHI